MRPPPFSGQNIMEAERINLIGNQLVDLSNRVNELRGYL
jgi:hypothetical protein